MNKLLIILSSLLVLSGCQKEIDRNEELRQKIENKKLTAVTYIKEVPELKVFSVYNYKSAGLKSPFRKTVSELKIEKIIVSNVKPDLEREKTLLENYDLETLKMTGTIKKKKEGLEAIIETMDRKVYIVKKGDYLGKNFGKIINISTSEISLKEIVPNGPSIWQERPSVITMSRRN